MKTPEQIKALILIKLKEHQTVMEELSEELKSLKKDGNIESAYKHMILKDRVLFSKACILALNDVLKEMEQ